MTLLRHYIEEFNKPFQKKRVVTLALLAWALLAVFVVTLATGVVGPEPLPATGEEAQNE